jgi:hypothetical protein
LSVPYQRAYGRPAAPQPPPRPTIHQVPVPRDSGAILALRVVTYVLTSLASLLFIALVVYGYVQLQQLRTAFEDAFGGLATPSVSVPQFPGQPGG